VLKDALRARRRAAIGIAGGVAARPNLRSRSGQGQDAC